MRRCLSVLVLVASTWLAAISVRATNFAQLTSTYLGDGWFQYELHVFDDPFFAKADVAWGLTFSNLLEFGSPPQNWTNSPVAAGFTSWGNTNEVQPRPSDQVFLAHSANTTYKLDTRTAYLLMSLYPAVWYDSPVFSGNIVGYVVTPCLVPCNPADADNSPTNFTCVVKIIPDITITRLTQTNGIINGVSFSTFDDSTLLLQGSSDLISWSNIAYLWASPPETTWTTNQNLGVFGQYFRMALIAAGHVTNNTIHPLDLSMLKTGRRSAKAVALATAIPRIVNCQVNATQVSVYVATKPNQTYVVQAVNVTGIVAASQRIQAMGDSAIVHFDSQNLPTPVFFKIAPTTP